ncbi:hypothetical protein PSHT_15694 [Puccinia striiformis]|uniref:Uncharacterized protein n=1 Tax=Puccinia striiformis TaxID=27350 RepID=A0A2S4UDW8_9BASI|nr:hypothetical protein PSHT_15694 [Puccinia striiformis]
MTHRTLLSWSKNSKLALQVDHILSSFTLLPLSRPPMDFRPRIITRIGFLLTLAINNPVEASEAFSQHIE